MQLHKALALFLSQHTETTQESYRGPLAAMRGALGPTREIEDIAPHHLIEYQQILKRRGYARATEAKHVKTIRTFFNWAVKIALIGSAPSKAMKMPRLTMAIEKNKAMGDGELRLLLEQVEFKPRDRALVLFLADTGCRAGGAAGLKVTDLDLVAMEAIVTEKGDKTRKVAYGVTCANALRVWLLKRPKGAGAYVFSRTAKPLTSDTISQIVRRACKAVGVRSLGSHSLRHRKGHQMAEARIAPSIAATALGHSDPTITLKHYYPADWASAKSALLELSTPPELPALKPKKVLKISGG